MINSFFNWCVLVLEVIGDVTGMGYELANIVIFVILQPALILLFFILACTAEAGKAKKYIYTVKNESGVKIKILGYPKFNPNNPNIINLENGEDFTETYQDVVTPKEYDFIPFFGGNRHRADLLRIIYNAIKYKDYNFRNNTDVRNPIFNLTGNTVETYIFTESDYENAENCNGNCK